MKIKKRVLNLFCVIGIAVISISGCGFYMSTEERISLFSQGKGAEIADDIQIEKLESLQFPQIKISTPPYSEKLFGKVLLGLSEEEVEQQEKDYREDLVEQGIPEAETSWVDIRFTNGDAYAMRTSGGLFYQAFSDARLYRWAILSAESILFPNARGVTANSLYHYDVLDSIFTKEQLDGCTEEQARQDADPVAEMLGYSLEESKIYAVDTDSLNEIHKITGMPLPSAEKDENGAVIKDVSEWTKEQEIYLILYKKVFQDKIIESVAAENVLFLYYHPEKKIIFAETEQPELSMEIKEERQKTVISGEEAVQMAQIYFGEQDTIPCTITEAAFRYMSPNANKNLTEKTVILDPCWKIEYYYTSSGKMIRDHILLNAETGELVGNNITY